MSKNMIVAFTLILLNGSVMGQQRESGHHRGGKGESSDRSTASAADRGTRTPAQNEVPSQPTEHHPPSPRPPIPQLPPYVPPVQHTCIVIDIERDASAEEARGQVILLDYRQQPEFAGFVFSEGEVVPYDDWNTDIFYEYADGYYYMNAGEGRDIVDLGRGVSSVKMDIPPEVWKHRSDIRLQSEHVYAVRLSEGDLFSFCVAQLSEAFVVLREVAQVDRPLTQRSVIDVDEIAKEESHGSLFGR